MVVPYLSEEGFDSPFILSHMDINIDHFSGTSLRFWTPRKVLPLRILFPPLKYRRWEGRSEAPPHQGTKAYIAFGDT